MSLKRIAVIDHDKCFPDKCNWLCQRKCPVNRVGKDCITQNTEKFKAEISEELCTGCGICPKICPFGAITIINLDVDFGEPIHSYGKNAFRLHRLPIPRAENVMGIVGRNGTGKSTALSILSGQLPPNMGKYEEKGSYEKAVEAYRGKELQNTFTNIVKGTQRVAVKPQAVEKIPAHFDGTVRQLLEKVSPEKVSAAAHALGIENVLDRQVKQLSGGELQKVAIAACGMKEAQVYFMDEPSSYLDIRERLRIAAYIRGLVGKEKGVLAIEHDLILLDYLSDNVHLMFGEPAVYGVVSSVQPTREGINTYLEGYAKEENYRFRSQPIKFIERSSRENKKQVPLLHWPGFQTKQGSFSLHAQEGKLHKQEVIGVLGPNGIGKTTFVKTLAGILTPEEGALPMRVPFAYKPQYVEAVPNVTVEQYLRDKMSPEARASKHFLVEPLHLPSLYEKQMDTLSGGELQRVAIAATLGSPAPLLLLDEPSANLDVEQRLQVAHTIRNVVETFEKTALIVDHDLMFMDYVSDRLLLFEGTPTQEGRVRGPMSMEEGMNGLLSQLGVTLRRDQNSKRPRINKPGSVKDAEQKKANQYYYTKA